MIKKVLVYTYAKQSHAAAIKAAASFASKHEAELMGLFVKPDVMGFVSVYGEYPLNLAQSFSDMQDDFSKQAQKEFEEIVAGYDCRTQWHEVNEYEDQPKPSLYTDFIFVSQPDTESSVIFNDTDFIDLLITQTGLPTVVIPRDWSGDQVGKHPLLGWKETKEAVGAVRHAMPLMQAAKKVDVLTVTKHTDLDEELIRGIEISEYLTERGVSCKFFTERMTKSDRNESEPLLRHADSYGCDLIVIGGYGHSRFREIILGGMTRSLLKHSPVPLLLSH